MTDQAKPISRPWRSFPRFSVRGLVVLVLVIGGGLVGSCGGRESSATLWRRSSKPMG